MLMIFNLQAQGDDSMMRMIIIIVVSLSVIGINFWLKSEKEKTIPKQKKRKIPRKRKVSYNSKEYEEWSSLRGSIKQRTPPMSWQLFRFNKSTFANLNQETWDALIKFDDGKISLNQLDEIYKKNEIKSDAKKTVKAKKDKAPDWFDVEESESLWEVIEYNRTLLSGSMSIEEEEINRNSVGMVMLNIRKRKLAKLPVNYFEALLKYINSDISKEELDEIL